MSMMKMSKQKLEQSIEGYMDLYLINDIVGNEKQAEHYLELGSRLNHLHMAQYMHDIAGEYLFEVVKSKLLTPSYHQLSSYSEMKELVETCTN